jgi:hypothetical protein
MRRRLAGALKIGGCLSLLMVSYIGLEVLLIRRAKPPEGVQDFRAFMRWRPETNRFFLHAVDGQEFLEAVGPSAGVVPSGPSGYVFDRSGRLIDRTMDSGDDSRFQRHYRSSAPRRILDLPAAEEWLQSNATQPARRADTAPGL